MMTSTIDRDGVRIVYDVHAGPDPATPLLLTHGYGASRRMWDGNVDVLSEARTVITWDMRGHGDSDAPDDESAYSHQATVADMAAVLEAVGAPRAAIGGLSLGGFMSLDIYRAHPQRACCLLLFDTGPGFNSDASRKRWNEYAAGLAEQEATSAPGLAKAARGMLAQQDAGVIRSLPAVRVPTLVLVGADDAPFLAAADYMAATIPAAEKVVLNGAGHAANIDQPKAFNDAVLAFLDRCR